MAQEEYFLALARMYQQGQAEANQNALALSQMLKADKRYEAEAPMRAAQLEGMLASNQATRAGTKATEAGTRATEVNTQLAEATAPFNVEKARIGAEQMREALIAAKNENDPRIAEANIKQRLAESLFSQYRAQSAQAQAGIDTDPSVIEARKQMTIIGQAAALSDLRMKDASLKEFLSGVSDRTAIREADVAKAKYEVAQQLDPEQLAAVKKLSVQSKQVEAALSQAQLRGVEGANFGNSLINLKRALGLNDIPEHLRGAVESYVSFKAAALQRDASPKAIAEFTTSYSQFLSALHSVGSKDPDMARVMTDAVAQATRMMSADLSASGKTGDANAALAAQVAILDRATDGAVVAGFSPQPQVDLGPIKKRPMSEMESEGLKAKEDRAARSFDLKFGGSGTRSTRGDALNEVFRPKFGQPK